MNNFFKRILSSIILLPFSFYIIIYGSYLFFFFTLVLFIISIFEWNKMIRNKLYKILGSTFLFFSFFTFYKLSTDLILVFFAILICVTTDIGGYLFGKIFKGPKLTKISPNKTYSGMLGGYFLSLLIISLISNLIYQMQISLKIIIIILFISTISQIGDIFVSYFKRLSKIKDTGNIIPGHGGLLDRIDGMIFVFPVLFIIQFFGYSII